MANAHDTANSIWITAKEAASLMGVSDRAVRKWCVNGKHFVIQESQGNGGVRYEVLLTSLPIDAQAKYWGDRATQMNATPIIPIDPLQEKAELDPDYELSQYGRAPAWNRRVADKYLTCFQVLAGLKGRQLEDAIDVWNTHHPEHRVSRTQYYERRRAYEKHGMSALLGNYGRNAGRLLSFEELGEFGDQMYRAFCGAYLHQNRLSPAECYRQVKGYVLTRLVDNAELAHDIVDRMPSLSTFMRRVRSDAGESGIFMKRHGEDAWQRKYSAYVQRDYTNMQVGAVWMSDHRQIDQQWVDADGKVLRPYVTVWCDMTTGYYLSWELSFDPPNADRIIRTFARAVEKYGIPRACYIDNGKDYRAKDFAGGRRKDREQDAGNLLTTLGVAVHFALPYNARAKNIERTFRDFKDMFDRGMPGFTGGNIIERPQEQLDEDRRRGRFLHFDHGKAYFDYFVTQIYHQRAVHGKKSQGRCRAEMWESERIALVMPDPQSIAWLKSRRSAVITIRRDGIHDPETKEIYYSPALAEHVGKKVYLRRDMDRYQTAFVIDARSHQYLCEAELGLLTADAMAEGDVKREELRQAQRMVNAAKKSVRARITSIGGTFPSPAQFLQASAAAVQHEAKATGTDGQITQIPDPQAGETRARKRVTQMNALGHMARTAEKQARIGLGEIPPSAAPPTPRKYAMFDCDLPTDNPTTDQ